MDQLGSIRDEQGISKIEGSWPHNGDIWLSGCLDLGQIGLSMVFEGETSLKCKVHGPTMSIFGFLGAWIWDK